MSDASVTPHPSSALEACALSACRGFLVGAVVGVPWSILLARRRYGGSLPATAAGALRSSGRLGGVLCAYTAARCGVAQHASPTTASLLAGALVVAVPTLASPARFKSNLAALRAALAPAGLGASLVGPAGGGCRSGLVGGVWSGHVFGCTDLALGGLFGIRWSCTMGGQPGLLIQVSGSVRSYGATGLSGGGVAAAGQRAAAHSRSNIDDQPLSRAAHTHDRCASNCRSGDLAVLKQQPVVEGGIG
jgi:hypothetical protein